MRDGVIVNCRLLATLALAKTPHDPFFRPVRL